MNTKTRLYDILLPHSSFDWHMDCFYLLTIVNNDTMQPRCPLTDEWVNKLWYIYTMEYYSAIKK